MFLMKKHFTRFTLLILALLGLPLTACTVQGTAAGTALTTTVVLAHAPQGSVDLTWNRNRQQLTISMHVSGLTPNSTHPTHIHQGTCNNPGAMLYPLPPLMANDLGQATLHTVIHVAHLPTQGWLSNVHNGPTMENAQSQIAIACGMFTMKERNASGLVKEHVVLQATTAPNESAHGTAVLSLDAKGTLHATVKIHGLQPGSRHAVHIHAGSCQAQGKMLYPLPTLVADKNGNATSTATFPNVMATPTTGVYINVHFAEIITDQQMHIIPQAFNPIACGNVPLKLT